MVISLYTLGVSTVGIQRARAKKKSRVLGLLGKVIGYQVKLFSPYNKRMNSIGM